MANILQLCVRYPPAPGGAETHVRSLSQGLKELGHSVEVYTSDLYKEFPFTKMEKEGRKNQDIPVKRHKAYALPGDLHYVFYPSLCGTLMKEDFDIYHAHSYGYFHVNAASFFKNLKETPLVLTPHYHPRWSMWGGEKREKIRGIYDSLIAQKVIGSVDRIIGVSKNEISLLSEALDVPKKKVRIIPNGINEDDFTPIPDGEKFRDMYDIDGKMVLFTGRLASNKGLIHLVETMPKVLEDHPDTTFVVIGEDEGMRSEIKNRASRLGVEEHLKIIDYIEDYSVFKASYSAADVFFLPSEYEAFGIVLLEAMMCGTPCVATRVGGVPEVVSDGETGYLCDYGDTGDFASRISELLEDPKGRKGMGREGRKRVKKKFTWKKVARQVSKVYEELI